MTQAAESFVATLAELGVKEDDVDPLELGRRAALLAVADLLWARHLGPSYQTREVRELLGCSRQAVSERAQRGTLLALPTDEGQLRFPVFQFGPTGQPLRGLPAIIETLRPAVASPYTIASWFMTSAPELEGKTPAEWLREDRDPGRAQGAAARYAARLAQ